MAGEQKFSTEKSLIIKPLHTSSICTMLLNNQLGDFHQTEVGLCQKLFLLPILSDIFLENIMQETIHDYLTSISISLRLICNILFADIDLMVGSNNNCKTLPTVWQRMDIKTKKSKVMSNTYGITSAKQALNMLWLLFPKLQYHLWG